jgi:hypothetical protein
MKPAALCALLCLFVDALATTAGEPKAFLPAEWMAAWDAPAASDRPLQIVHEIDLAGKLPEGMNQLLPTGTPDGIARKSLEYYQQRGLGGLVCNVSFRDYLKSVDNWAKLTRSVEACRDLGINVWIYDELGYPSGGAGGLVVGRNREFEAQELAYDAAQADPFILRPAYEFTHASNNYHAARRYVNLMDDRAIRCFLEVTHDAYYEHLGPLFGKTIQAMFTDEPSLIAVNIGQIPEEVRKQVQVVDPLDPGVKLLPRVPWCYDLAERYRERFGQDLNTQRLSLFQGDSDQDRQIRTQFWSLVADLVADRYFGALEDWCQQHGVASSGHGLWEEAVLHHVPLVGNGLKCLGRMHIPGLDLLNSDPEAVVHTGWLTAGLPASAARLHGRRRIMTEVSDFSQKMSGQGPAGLAEMQATAAWQATWGVTDFTLYYSTADRSADEFRQYGDFVGRLNAILKPAAPAPEVLLYYPIHDLWGEYLPVAEPLQLSSQSPRAQQLVNSFMRLGQTLQRSQIPVTVIDHEMLAACQVKSDGRLTIGGIAYRALALPHGVELPAAAAEVVKQFESQGGRVVRSGVDQTESSALSLVTALGTRSLVEPSSPQIAVGRFHRDGREILLLVNVSKQPYTGTLLSTAAATGLLLDPASGLSKSVTADEEGHLPLQLEPRACRIYVADQSR